MNLNVFTNDYAPSRGQSVPCQTVVFPVKFTVEFKSSYVAFNGIGMSAILLMVQ